jgi:hypothetical protein
MNYILIYLLPRKNLNFSTVSDKPVNLSWNIIYCTPFQQEQAIRSFLYDAECTENIINGDGTDE